MKLLAGIVALIALVIFLCGVYCVNSNLSEVKQSFLGTVFTDEMIAEAKKEAITEWFYVALSCAGGATVGVFLVSKKMDKWSEDEMI